jgi:type IV secretion system protein VirB8
MSGIARPLILAKTVTSDPGVADAYFRQVGSYADDRLRSAKRGQALAWTVAIAEGIVIGGLVFAVVVQSIRPMPDPLVLREDKTTGMIDRVYDVAGGEMAATEATNRYSLWQFVRAAEGYSWPEAQQNFDTVTLMATPDVQKQVAARVNGSNPQSPQVVLGRTGQATLSWVSTTFLGPKLAQVRYVQIERKGDNVLPKKNMVATVAFDFATGPIRGGAINVNPLGFLVTNYHVDREDAQ